MSWPPLSGSIYFNMKIPNRERESTSCTYWQTLFFKSTSDPYLFGFTGKTNQLEPSLCYFTRRHTQASSRPGCGFRERLPLTHPSVEDAHIIAWVHKSCQWVCPGKAHLTWTSAEIVHIKSRLIIFRNMTIKTWYNLCGLVNQEIFQLVQTRYYQVWKQTMSKSLMNIDESPLHLGSWEKLKNVRLA